MSRRRRLVRLAAWTLASVAIGLLAGWYLGVAGMAAGPVWIAVVVAVRRALIRYRFPARCREMTRRFVDPSAGPPPGTEPVALDAPRTWADAITAKDWRAARAVLAEDLAVVNAVDPGRYGRTVYMRAMRTIALACPDLRIEVDEVVGRPAA